MSPAPSTITPQPASPFKRPRGRPSAQRPARISTRITQAAHHHLQQIRAQHPGTLAATLEALILQFPVESNTKTHTLPHPT